MRTWYDIQDKTQTADVYLYDEIGAWGITADTFVKDISGVKAPTINLFVNSPGGDAFGGMAIYNALKRHPSSVNATVDGLAASSASFIVQAANRITMAEGSTMMIHEPYSLTMGNSDDHAKSAEMLSKMADNIAGIYANRAGGTEAQWRERMKAESWYRADEAVEIGLADERLVDTVKVAALVGRVFNLARFKHVPEWISATADEEPQDIKLDLSSGITPEPPAPSLESLLKKYPAKLEPVGGSK